MIIENNSFYKTHLRKS